jgi:hypothetical protein
MAFQQPRTKASNAQNNVPRGYLLRPQKAPISNGKNEPIY